MISTVDNNNGQQSAVLHASLMPFLVHYVPPAKYYCLLSGVVAQYCLPGPECMLRPTFLCYFNLIRDRIQEKIIATGETLQAITAFHFFWPFLTNFSGPPHPNQYNF